MSYFKLIAMRPEKPEEKWVNPADIPKVLDLCTPKVSALIKAARSQNTSFNMDAQFWSETDLKSPSQKCSTQNERFQHLISTKFKPTESYDQKSLDEYKLSLNKIDMTSLLFLPVSYEITGVDIAIAALCGIWLVGVPKTPVKGHGAQIPPLDFMQHDILHFKDSFEKINYFGADYSGFCKSFLVATESLPINQLDSHDDRKIVLSVYFICFHEACMSLEDILTEKHNFLSPKSSARYDSDVKDFLVKNYPLRLEFESLLNKAFGRFSEFIDRTFNCPKADSFQSKEMREKHYVYFLNL